MLSTFLVRLGLPLALKFSVYQPSFYQKSLAFEEEAVVHMMASEFLTLIINLLEEEFAVVPITRKEDPCAKVLHLWNSEIPACFMMLIFGKFQSRVRLCSHGVLNKSTFHHHVEILTQVLLVKHLFLTGRSDFICTTECCFQWHMHRKMLYVYHVTWENLHGEGMHDAEEREKEQAQHTWFQS